MRFHDLRHTTATLLLRAGVDAHRVQRLLRHRDVRTTTGIYGHLDVEDLRTAIEKLPELGPNGPHPPGRDRKWSRQYRDL
jgi:site-specific recombinase XerD